SARGIGRSSDRGSVDRGSVYRPRSSLGSAGLSFSKLLVSRSVGLSRRTQRKSFRETPKREGKVSPRQFPGEGATTSEPNRPWFSSKGPAVKNRVFLAPLLGLPLPKA